MHSEEWSHHGEQGGGLIKSRSAVQMTLSCRSEESQEAGTALMR